MNLDNNPTKDQLADLLRACDDRVNHILWVTRDGEVRITPLADGETEAGFEKNHPEAQLRCRYFEAGHDYVGPGAARDTGWIEDVFHALTHEWPNARGKAMRLRRCPPSVASRRH